MASQSRGGGHQGGFPDCTEQAAGLFLRSLSSSCGRLVDSSWRTEPTTPVIETFSSCSTTQRSSPASLCRQLQGAYPQRVGASPEGRHNANVGRSEEGRVG